MCRTTSKSGDVEKGTDLEFLLNFLNLIGFYYILDGATQENSTDGPKKCIYMDDALTQASKA